MNYSASEREMLAIVLSVERFKQYVYGREFLILTDHMPLKFLLTADVPDARLARLMNRLLIYINSSLNALKESTNSYLNF